MAWILPPKSHQRICFFFCPPSPLAADRGTVWTVFVTRISRLSIGGFSLLQVNKWLQLSASARPSAPRNLRGVPDVCLFFQKHGFDICPLVSCLRLRNTISLLPEGSIEHLTHAHALTGIKSTFRNWFDLIKDCFSW